VSPPRLSRIVVVSRRVDVGRRGEPILVPKNRHCNGRTGVSAGHVGPGRLT
jgi:hypothetical protein